MRSSAWSTAFAGSPAAVRKSGQGVACAALAAMSALPSARAARAQVVINGVRTNEHPVCTVDAGRGDALALWEAARAGLLASVSARETAPPTIRVRRYRRVLDPVLHRPVADTIEYVEQVEPRSFVAARSPLALADSGYIREERDGSRNYFAPDDEVLLDPSFAETHCLSVIEGRGPRVGQVGLAFDPIRLPERDTLVDVRGVLWLDVARQTLQTLEFQYTNLEREARGSGGTVDFAMMPTGVPMISRWEIHSPMLAMELPPPNEPTRRLRPRPERDNVYLLGHRNTGGEVAVATWPDGQRWEGNLPRVQGILTDPDGHPVTNARIWLDDLRDTVRSGPDGRFHFPPMPPGLYTVRASDSALAAAGIGRAVPRRFALFATENANLDMLFYPRSMVFPTICPTGTYRPNTGVLLARVVDSTGSPVTAAAIDVAVGMPGDTNAIDGRALRRIGMTDMNGRFVVCGAEPDRRLVVRASQGNWAGAIAVERWGDEILSVTIHLRSVPSGVQPTSS